MFYRVTWFVIRPTVRGLMLDNDVCIIGIYEDWVNKKREGRAEKKLIYEL